MLPSPYWLLPTFTPVSRRSLGGKGGHLKPGLCHPLYVSCALTLLGMRHKIF